MKFKSLNLSIMKESTNYQPEEYMYKILYIEATDGWKGWKNKPSLRFLRKHKDSYFVDDKLSLPSLKPNWELSSSNLINSIKNEVKPHRTNLAEWGKSSEHLYQIEWETKWMDINQLEEYLSLDNIDVNRITESKFWTEY